VPTTSAADCRANRVRRFARCCLAVLAPAYDGQINVRPAVLAPSRHSRQVERIPRSGHRRRGLPTWSTYTTTFSHSLVVE